MFLLCAAGFTLGTNGEISWTDAQRDVDAVRSIMFDKAVLLLHAGDVVQGYSSDTSGERWSTGGLGGIEMFVLHHEPTSLTRSAGLLQELLSFSFEAKRCLEWLSSTATRKRAARRFQRNIRVGVALRMLPDGP